MGDGGKGKAWLGQREGDPPSFTATLQAPCRRHQSHEVGAESLISEEGCLESYPNRNIHTGLCVNKNVLLCVEC